VYKEAVYSWAFNATFVTTNQFNEADQVTVLSYPNDVARLLYTYQNGVLKKSRASKARGLLRIEKCFHLCLHAFIHLDERRLGAFETFAGEFLCRVVVHRASPSSRPSPPVLEKEALHGREADSVSPDGGSGEGAGLGK